MLALTQDLHGPEPLLTHPTVELSCGQMNNYAPWPADKLEHSGVGLDVGYHDGGYYSTSPLLLAPSRPSPSSLSPSRPLSSWRISHSELMPVRD